MASLESSVEYVESLSISSVLNVTSVVLFSITSRESSSSSHHSSPSSSSSIGLLVVSTGISSSSTHGCLLQSSDANAMVSSPHLEGATALPSAMHRTFRVRLPPPHVLVQSLHGPVNHWPSHFLPVSHSFEFSGFSDASHFDSSSAGATPLSLNFPQRTFLV